MSAPAPGSGQAPIARRVHRPTREEILAARKARRTSVTLVAASLSWAVLATLVLDHLASRGGEISVWTAAVVLSPAVVMGLFAGRRVRTAYFYAMFVVAAPLMVFGLGPVLTIFFVCAAILVLGYGSELVLCAVTGRRWRDLDRRAADAPRGVGGASTANGGVRWKESATIANAAPTGRELRQRKIP